MASALLDAAADALLAALPEMTGPDASYRAANGKAVEIVAGPMADVPPPDAGHLTYTERLVLQSLNANEGPMTGPEIVADIERATGEPCSYGYLRRVLNGLKARGIVESLGNGRGYRAICY